MRATNILLYFHLYAQRESISRYSIIMLDRTSQFNYVSKSFAPRTVLCVVVNYVLPPDKTIDKAFEGELTLILMLIYISTPGETNTANSPVCFNFSKSASKRRDLQNKNQENHFQWWDWYFVFSGAIRRNQEKSEPRPFCNYVRKGPWR